MTKLLSVLGRGRSRSERGASATEYGLVVSAIAAVIAVVVYSFGDNVTDLFDDTCDTVAAARSTAECATE
jgi:pilus assembly protein Flp/PilA